MATVTKLTPTGIHYSGEIDEATFNANSGYTKNLATWSEQFTNPVWSSITRAGILTNTDIAPDGTKTASTLYNTLGNSTGYIRRTYPVVNGQTYCYSIYAKAKELNYLWLQNFTDAGAFAGDQVAFDLINGNISYNPSPSRIFYPTITSVGNEWYRCSMCQTVGLNYTYTGAGGIVAAGPGSQFGAAGTGDGKSGILIWGAQMEQLNSVPSIYTSMTTVPTPVAKRVDYNGKIYISGTFDEATFNSNSPVIKNLFNYTETFDFDYTNWTYNSGLIKQNAILAPDGVSLAPKFIEFSGLGNQRFYNWMPLDAGITYTYSIYLKAAERYIVRCYTEDIQSGGGGRVGAYLNLRTGTIITPYITGTNTLLGSKLEAVGNDWFRFSWTVRAVLSANLNTTGFMIVGMAIDEVPNFNYVGDGNSGIYIWGAQKEIADSVGIYQGVGAPNTLIPTKFKQRVQTQGDTYIAGNYDEWTGFNVVTNGLIVHLDAAIPTSWPGSGTTWYDLSGNGLNATPIYYITTLPYFDISSYSFAFQYPLSQRPMVLSNIAAVKTPSFSCEAWVKQTAYNANDQYWNQLFGGEEYLKNGFRCGVTSAGRVVFWTDQSGGNFALQSNITTTLNTFYHLVITYDLPSRTANMYINGVNVGTVRNAVYNVPTLTSQFGIGSGVGGTYDQIGNIATFKMYNRAISQQEASDNFTATRNRFGV